MSSAGGRWGRVVPMLLVALAGAPLHAENALRAQDVSVMPYLGAGPETNGLSAAAGIRLDVRRTWGGYGRAAWRLATVTCVGSMCNYPEGHTGEYAGGITYSSRSGERWLVLASVGAGVLSWQNETDPFVELGGDARRALGERLALVFGLHVVVAPRVERERSGHQAIVSRKDVVFPNAVLGLAIRL